MTILRRFCAVAALTLVLALPALAEGQMEFPGVPPPPPVQNMTVATAPGQTGSPVNTPGTGPVPEEAPTDPVTEILLSLVQSILPFI